MNLLCLSTPEPGGSLAFMARGRLVFEEYWDTRITHAARLMQSMDDMLARRVGLSIHSVDGLVVARGPGSFTGLRIGMSVAMGVACALGKPVAGISSLDGIGFRFSHAAIPVCVMMDAGRNQVYTAVYEFRYGRLIQKSAEAVCDPDHATDPVQNAHALFAGSGALVYQEKIQHKHRDLAVMAAPEQHHISAAVLGYAAMSQPECFTEAGSRISPVYLRKSDARVVPGEMPP